MAPDMVMQGDHLTAWSRHWNYPQDSCTRPLRSDLGWIGWRVGRGNISEDVFQFTGHMTVETVWPNGAVQVIAMTEPGAGSRVSAGIDPMKVDDIVTICQPSHGMIRAADHTVWAIVAGKTADPGDAPIKVETVTLRTKIDADGRVRRS